MTRRVTLLSLILFLPLFTVALMARVSNLASQEPIPSEKIDEALAARLAEHPHEPVRFIVHLAEQAGLTENLPTERLQRRTAVVQRLQQTASTSQAQLRAFLAERQVAGVVNSYQPLWIVNAIIVEGHASLVDELARRSDVEQITLDARRKYLNPPELQPQEGPSESWNLTHIRALQTWEGLGITGLGVTIAIMDTGVDWTHPDLRNNYRGRQDDGSVTHDGHWFDAVELNSTSGPIDPNGHGTHVAGTAVGQGGTGVAPGASWIAVRAFDSSGFGSTANIHLAFQWLLAPAGQPELAPDVVNGSWSGNGANPEFLPDLQVLHQAGIAAVFAAGNAGPDGGTIGAPASYPGAIAVAALDYRDEVAWFSARGPSPLTNRPKPDLAAPGARIYSTVPGNSYANYNGTSMAAPHVSGAVALLLSANPALTPAELTRVLTETARANGSGHNVHRGWGYLDAYAAVASQTVVGEIEGTVTSAGVPVPGAAVTVTTPAGGSLRLDTDQSGNYHAWLRPGDYHLRAGHYGYSVASPIAIEVRAGGTAHQNLLLARQPHAVVTGRVTSDANGASISDATVIVEGTPVSATTDANGGYQLALPTGEIYTFRVQRTAYRLSATSVALASSLPVSQDFQLQPAQAILLIDSGGWYYDSYVSYYREALQTAGYAFDVWPIYSPEDTPPAETLDLYDTVIWTAPQDSPAWIGGADALVEYLEGGGNLLVSGQNVARRDGASPTAHRWFTQYIQGRYLGAAVAPYSLTGVSGGPYYGLDFALNSPDSAANQFIPSRVGTRERSLTRPLLTYLNDSDDAAAGLQAGWCQPYRALFLGFGLEGAGPAPVRTALLERALAYFDAPPVARAIALTPSQTNEVVLPGQTLTVTYALQNLSEVQTTTVNLELEAQWPTTLSQQSAELGPCQQQAITLTLKAPALLEPGSLEAVEITARADYGAVTGASVVASAPAPVLLVADYRWYDKTEEYQAALRDLGLSFDIWDTNRRGSPGLERLAAYDAVVWFTGYDWYAPLTGGEIEALRSYLQAGGRLFLTSQDYLYYHRSDPFTRDFLGVIDYQETLTSTAVVGGPNALVGDGIGPLALSFAPYRNFSDALVSAPFADNYLWSNLGLSVSTATSRDRWRSIFWSVPFELLPPATRPQLMANVLGWLEDVGDSTIAVTPRAASVTAHRHYSFTIRNMADTLAHVVNVSVTVDAGLVVDPLSLTGDASFDAGSNVIVWQESLAGGDEHLITFTAQPHPTLSPGTRLDVTSTIVYEGQLLPWQRVVPTWVDAPDLSTSDLRLAADLVQPYNVTTITALIENRATLPATAVSATLTLPRGLTPITDTLYSTLGDISIADRQILWLGSSQPQSPVTITLALSATGTLRERSLPLGLYIGDGFTTPIIRNRTLQVAPYRLWMPLIGQGQYPDAATPPAQKHLIPGHR